MTKYVALLRGINVGGNKKVDMKKLKNVFESLNFANVSTYINSGNVIFETHQKNVEVVIEAALRELFGFEIPVVVRDAKSIEKVCTSLPQEWKNDQEQRTDILFLRVPYASKKSIELIKATSVDELIYIDGAIAWNVKRHNMNKSGMKKFIGSVLYKHMTARNINTVRMLNELMQ